jgi:hypothetical protein
MLWRWSFLVFLHECSRISCSSNVCFWKPQPAW